MRELFFVRAIFFSDKYRRLVYYINEIYDSSKEKRDEKAYYYEK